MRGMGVGVPTNGTRVVVQNVATSAGLMLTTAFMVAEHPEDKPAPGGMGGGGMGGMEGMM